MLSARIFRFLANEVVCWNDVVLKLACRHLLSSANNICACASESFAGVLSVILSDKNEDGTGGSVQGGGEGGEGGEGGSTAVSEVSNTTAVTVVNAQILVNGEAPAFVVTVSGQKIANANLRAGVYFVVADGNSVSVVVQ